MKILVVFILFMGLFSACASQNRVENKSKMKKVEESSNYSSSISSTTDVKEVVTDPITMDRCDKNVAIEYDGNFFCSPQSVDKYKEQKAQ